MNNISLAIHGGAGNYTLSDLSLEEQKEYQQKLQEALDRGYDILEKGGSSIDAVEAVIRILEDSPLFNAGKGAVLTSNEKIELDASIMRGSDLAAGAVGGVTIVKNPISAARKVMENSPHVLLMGRGAEAFAKEQHLEIVDPSYFFTEKSRMQLQKIKEEEKLKLKNSEKKDKKFGTVGCVALDKNGNLAAGTSTGGMVNKKFGRVGDSPIIGAGTYADNRTCAVSCTGHGEHFIRNTIAFSVAALMEYKGLSLEQAVDYVVEEKLKRTSGTGGLIAIDKEGNIAMKMNTPSMFRAYRNTKESKVFIF
ncbi:MAG: isoaspartyl peptidase/L-asparaginase [Cytophagaceae bacterium]|nr:isoaspartyl peptidase/L-asparaginase [Cytophagaceae bacterium]